MNDFDVIPSLEFSLQFANYRPGEVPNFEEQDELLSGNLSIARSRSYF